MLLSLFEGKTLEFNRREVKMIGIRFCPVSAARARGIVAGRAKWLVELVDHLSSPTVSVAPV
jgi:hypothetical protein